MALGKKTGGRKKGQPNKLTRDAREAVAKAFDGVGGIEALTEWALNNPSEFYTRVWVRTIPDEQKHQITGRVGVVVLPAVK